MTAPPATVVIPFKPGCRWRERSLELVAARWAELGWPVTVAEAGPDERWCKGRLFNAGAARASTPVVVMADADVWAPSIAQAVAAVADGHAPWALPHDRVERLDDTTTRRIHFEGRVPDDPSPYSYARRPYPGVPGGGLAAVPAEHPPMDERFVDWGNQDIAWGIALDTLLGAHQRTDGPLWHLWHPPQRTRNPGRNGAVLDQYRQARSNPTQMARVLAGHRPSPEGWRRISPRLFECCHCGYQTRHEGRIARHVTNQHREAS